MTGLSSARSPTSRSPTVSALSPSWLAAGRTSNASRRPRSASLASCRTIHRAAAEQATRSGWIRLRAPSRSAETLRAAGYDVARELDARSLIAALSEGPPEPTLTLAEYEAELAATPADFRRSLFAAWGEPADDRNAIGDAFCFRFVRLGSLIVAAQPDRGDARTRKGDYHDLNLPPRHGYVAFHFWLTRNEKVDAIIQLGAHGTLEWLPGKAVALSEACAPEVLIGPTPVVYPFIVNNPGEAAQAKRRIGAATIGHLTPPLIAAGSHGATLELEGLFDEFAEAQALDPRRARAIAALILERGRETGLLEECAAKDKPPEEALVALDAWLCDLKDMRVGDGLHVFGRSPESADGFAGLGLDAAARETLSERVAACGAAESLGLIRALGGSSSPPARPAHRRAAASTFCRPAATSTRSIRAPRRRASPGRSAAARPRRSWRATRRTMATGRSASSSTFGAQRPCALAATIWRRPSR